MRRIFSRTEKDDIVNEMVTLEKDIRHLENQESLSEWEWKTLEMKKKKLRHLRSM